MNKNLLIVLGGGFLIALLVAIIVQASFGNKGEGMVEVAVAVKSLPAGTPVTDDAFKWQEWPEDSVFEGAIRREGNKKIADMAKGKLRRDMNAGEPLTQVALTTAGKGNMLAASMDPGMRAVAIKVSAQAMVGGFLAPGDRVDVILTYQVRLSGAEREEAETKVNRHASQTVLENVKILAIDQTARKEDDKAKVGRTVTLEVDAAGAEKLALATEMGELSLALRALGDTETVNTKGKRLTTDVQVSSVLQEINRMKKTSGGKSDIVRVYSGENVENVTVRH
jgi:pilus assembly protein CpaB